MWRIQPWDLVVFAAAVVFAFFFTAEIGVYVSLGLALVILLVRMILQPAWSPVGRIAVRGPSGAEKTEEYITTARLGVDRAAATAPLSGVPVIRLQQSLTYPSADSLGEHIVAFIEQRARRAAPAAADTGQRRRLWSEYVAVKHRGTRSPAAVDGAVDLPELRAVILDFSDVRYLDSTGAQALVDIRHAIDRWAGRAVEWHVAGTATRGVYQALRAVGFGAGDAAPPSNVSPVAPSCDDGDYRPAALSDDACNRGVEAGTHQAPGRAAKTADGTAGGPPNGGGQRRFFHATLHSALAAVGRGD
jgi:sodium-independent sulfate anion transporter 11